MSTLKTYPRKRRGLICDIVVGLLVAGHCKSLLHLAESTSMIKNGTFGPQKVLQLMSFLV